MALLACGAVAGPLFVVVTVVEAFTRSGFDITRHPPSLLSLGDLGWIQVTNFVLSGSLFVAGAAGMRRASASKWSSGPIAVFGAAMIVGGIFVVDGGLGFPDGAPAGQPSTMSSHAVVHLSAFAIGFAALVAACGVWACGFWIDARRNWALYSLTAGVLSAACFVIVMSGLTQGNLLPLWFAVMVGWTWASAMAARLTWVSAARI